MKRWLLAVLVLVAVCGGAFAAFGSRGPLQEIARESLDLLKAMGSRSPVAHAYVASCVTAIAAAKRHEDRRDASEASLHGVWTHAAGSCRGMADAVCEALTLEAPREACSRIRAAAPLL
jgi:hypothetical protein